MPEKDLAAIRFGYGLGPEAEMNKGPADAADLYRGLMLPDRVSETYPMLKADAAADLHVRFQAAQRAQRKGEPGAQDAVKAIRGEMAKIGRDNLRLSVARCLDAESRLRERLVMFWADHFTARPKSNVAGVYVQPYLNETIRPNVTGRFADMLKAVAVSPLMLLYLDQNSSFGPNSVVGLKQGRGLNENLARELLELHTLGVEGAYTQDDVRQLAELLTGLNFRPKDGFAFRPALAEPGAETVLDTSYGGDPARLEAIHAVLEDLSVHPDTARHIARKLAMHFVADDPPAALVEALEQGWLASGGDLLAVYGVLLTHPASWTTELQKAKQPYDFIVSALVALGVGGAELLALKRQAFHRDIDLPMRRMGQRFFAPPGPDGWPEEQEAWITPQGLSTRIRWSLEAPVRLVDPLPDARTFVQTALGTFAPERLVRATAGAETLVQGVALVLSSPTFNRR